MISRLLFILLIISSNTVHSNLDSLKKALAKANHDSVRINLLERMIEIGDDNEWPVFNEQYKAICEKNLASLNEKDPSYSYYLKNYSGALNNAGYYEKLRGNTLSAIKNYEACIKIDQKMNNRDGMATTLLNLAVIYENQGDISKGIERLFQALKIQEELKDEKMIAYSLNYIGLFYKKLGESEKAREFYEKAKMLREKIKDYTGLSLTLNDLGTLHSENKEYETALNYFNQSLELKKYGKEQSGTAETYLNLGIIYQELGNFEKAKEYHHKSVDIARATASKGSLANIINHLGLFYAARKDYKLAQKYSEEAFEMGKSIGYPEVIKRSALSLSNIYKGSGNFAKALHYYETFIVMRDSINNQSNRKVLIRAQLQNEYDKKATADSITHANEAQIKNALLEKQETEIKNKKQQQYFLFGGLALVMAFAGISYNRFRITRKQKNIIEAKEEETKKQNEIITQQKNLVEEKQKEILDSINYARRIQYTLLAHEDFLRDNLPEHFVYFRPKDIVSGDFYWASNYNTETNENLFYFAVCDSTGHGVPGAFMSLLNIGFLTEAINEKGIRKPNEIFNYVRQKLIDNISKEGQQDGFDGVLICIDKSTRKLSYAAGNNAPVLVRNGEVFELENNRMPIGIGERTESFNHYELNIEKNDMLFLYTDGFADQFGGPKGKKFKYRALNELLKSNAQLNCTFQKEKLEETFSNWKGDLEQIDDVCVIGIRF